MAAEIFSLMGSIGLKGAEKVKAQLTEVDKAGRKTSDGMDGSNKKTGASSTSLSTKIGNAYTQMSGHVSLFATGATANLSKYGQKMTSTGQTMQSFGASGKAMLGAVGLSAAGMGAAVAGGMKRLDALNGANLTFQAFNAAGDKSFGNVEKAAADMTKNTTMSVGDFAKSVDKYVAKGVPRAAAMATTSLNAFTKGTSVGMTDAAQSTARFNSVGMDLKQSTNTFKDMTRVLAGTGNATSLSMETASTAISRMAADGKVNLGDMNQLLNAMPDAMKMLSDSTGMSMGELRKAVSDGKVSYDDFAKAMTGRANEVDALFAKQGGVMAQTGKSFEGSISNLKAAVARFGATILESIGQSNITDAIANVGAKLDELGTKIAPVIKDMVNFGVKAFEMIQPFIPMIASFAAVSASASVVGGVLTKVGGAMTFLGASSRNLAMGGLMLLITLLINAYATNEDFRNTVNQVAAALGDFYSSIQPVLQPIGDFVGWLLKAVATSPVLLGAITALAGGIGAMMVIKKVATGFAMFNAVLAANPIGAIVTAIALLVTGIIYFFTQMETGKSIWQGFITWLQDVWNAIPSFFQGVWDGIIDIFNTAVEWVKSFLASGWGQAILMLVFPLGGVINLIVQHWDTIKNVFQASVEWIKNVISAGWELMKSVIDVGMNLIWSAIQIYWQLIKLAFDFWVGGLVAFVKWSFEMIKTGIQLAMDGIKAVIETVWGYIGPYIMGVVNGISTVMTTVWNFIRQTISTVVNGIMQVVLGVWNVISTTTTTVFNAIKGVVSAVWSLISNAITTYVNNVKNNVTMAWNTISQVTTAVFNAVKGFITSVWNAIVGFITNNVAKIKAVVTQAWNGVRQVTTSVFNAVKSTITSVWNSISSFITNTVNKIKSTISNVFNSLKGITSSAFNGVKSAATSVMNGVLSTITGIVNKIKGAFNFKLKFPEIKIPKIPMPHFKMSGEFNPLKGKIPKVGIDWYAKGGIMTRPTAFGMNGNNLMVGGEAGREAILPLNKNTLGQIGEGIVASTAESETDNSTETVINVTQNIHSHDSLTPREMQRQARTQLEQLGRFA